jgi:RHS repeat-associated protein
MFDRPARRSAAGTRKLRGGLHACLALGLGFALVIGTQQQGLTAAAATKRETPVHVAKDKPLKTRAATSERRPVDQAQSRVLTGSPKISWPGTGTAELAPPKQSTSLAVNRDQKALRATAPGLPLWVSPSDSTRQSKVADAPAKVKVESRGRQGDALALTIQRTDGRTKTGSVKLGLNYSQFRDTYGGDWANRLRIVSAGKVLPTRNNGDGELSADVPVAATASSVFVVAGASSGAGDYKRGDQSGGSATWNIGGSSGNFEWSLPLEVPPGTGGPQPDLALQYSSGGVDGLSSATNNQTSIVGQGFSLGGGGAIERRFKSCAKDKTGGNNATLDSGDLCFAGDTINVSVNGKSGSLVLDHSDASGEFWRMRGDDGSLIEHKYGAVNGDAGGTAAETGEYWVMTQADGSKFYFGLNRLPGWQPGNEETRSAWTAPVFGNHPGEQCNKATFAASWCQQAYQWNLDYVVDRNGNTMSLFYDTEIENYARAVTATAVSQYVRAGNLKRIDYGQRDAQTFAQKAVAQAVFSTAERCTPAPCGPAQPASYPDTPWDMSCKSTTNCLNHYTPTFWTQKRLEKVTTKIWRAGSSTFDDVQSWSLRHEYLRGDNTSPALWLKGIVPAGYVGGQPIQLPETSFDGVAGANRVDTASDMIPPLEWFRINTVHYGTGGDLGVTYDGIECTPANLPTVDHNDKRCRPQKWTPEGAAERTDWYHKYVVTTVTEADRTVSASDPWQAPVPVTTTVQYLDKPAWRFEEQDAGTDLKDSTWSQWRGYSKVRLIKGNANETKTIDDTLYFRGMDGDRTTAGPAKQVSITDSNGTAVPDTNEFSGQSRERIKYGASTSTVVDKSITDYWLSPPTATMTRPWGTLTSRKTGDKDLKQWRATDSGMLVTGTENTFDASGRLAAKQESNDLSTTADDTCTRYEYAQSTTKGLLEVPIRQQTVAKACDATWTNADVVSDNRLYYDGATSPTTPPSRGLVTKVERLSGFDAGGQATYETQYAASYDANGRQTEITNGLQQTKRTVVTPSYGPVTQSVEIAANGQETTTRFEPAFGEAVGVTRPDGTTASTQLDALGRKTKAWGPGHPTSGPADLEYEYLNRDTGAAVVTTKKRVDAVTTQVTYDLYDGLQRLRQTQAPAPGGGWIVTDHRYDSRGHESKVNGPYYTDAIAEKELNLVNEQLLPKQEVTTYDEADRPKAQIFNSAGTEQWRINHDVTANRQTMDPPAGETATMRLSDSLGRLIELRQYPGGHPTGTVYDKTTYSYTPTGQLKTITDPAGNAWRYDYDPQGRKIKEMDPDKGITTYTYDAADQMTSSTDARGTKLSYQYDNVGRKTAVQKDSPTGPTLATWTYDTVAKGMFSSSTRYVGNDAYTTKVTGYDPAGRPTGQQVILPASEGALAGTYTTAQTYTPDGQLATRTLPAVGGLPAETLTYSYNDRSRPISLTGADTYVRNMAYTPFDDPSVLTLGTANGSWVQQTFEHDTATRRLTRVITEKQLSPRRVSDVNYEYDPAGNVTRVSDIPSATTGEATDTQCFNYDYLRRLTQAWTPKPGATNEPGDCAATPSAASLGGPAPYWQKWTLDKVGNRTSEQTVTPTGTTTSTYEYGGKPHQLNKVTTTTAGGTTTKTFGYDAVGALTSRTVGSDTETFAWDGEGHLSSTAKGGATTSSAVYDTEGDRLLRKDSAGTVLTLGETELRLGTDGKTLSGTRYYTFDNEVIAVRTGGNLSWLLGDLHGTPTIAIDATTQTVERKRSLPYGDSRGAAPASWPGQQTFQRGTADTGTNLIHMGAREYDPSTGRFISVDPVIDPQQPQQLHGYAYANNNPTSMEDSDGRFVVVLVIPVIVVVVVVVVVMYLLLVSFMQAVTQVQTRSVQDSVWDFFSWLWKTITKVITYLVTVMVEMWKWIEQRIEQLVTVVHVLMRTVIRNIPDKIPPRKNTTHNQNQAKGKAEQPTRPPKNSKPPKKPAKGKEVDKQSRGKDEKTKRDAFGEHRSAPKDLNRAKENNFNQTLDEFLKGRIDPTKTSAETRQPVNEIKPGFSTTDFGSMMPKGGWGGAAWWTAVTVNGGAGVLKFFDKYGSLFGH